MTEVERAKKRETADSEYYDHEYDLYLQSDTNAVEGLMHWYYFRILTKGIKAGTKIRLNIRNLHRTKSLYESGMLPRIYYHDQDSVDNEQKGWHIDPKVTQHIKFFQSNQNDNFDA